MRWRSPHGREETPLSTAPRGADTPRPLDGPPHPEAPNGLARFNAAPGSHVLAELISCCAAPSWASAVADDRPYPSVDAVLVRASIALAELDEGEVDEALAGHPRIGERAEHASSRREQSGVAGADPTVLAALAEDNRAYEQRFGHVYLVFADGRSAEDLLDLLRDRLANDPATERRVLRAELEKINRLRVTRLLESA